LTTGAKLTVVHSFCQAYNFSKCGLTLRRPQSSFVATENMWMFWCSEQVPQLVVAHLVLLCWSGGAGDCF